MPFVPAAVLGVATPVLTGVSQTSFLRPEIAHLSRPTAPQAKLTSAKHLPCCLLGSYLGEIVKDPEWNLATWVIEVIHEN